MHMNLILNQSEIILFSFIKFNVISVFHSYI